jgi:hypothetical protein
MHYDIKPKGEWWEKSEKYITKHVAAYYPATINNIPAKVIHQVDYYKLAVLKVYGGFALDLDILSLRPFTDLRDNSAVVARQDNYVTCGAFLASEPGSMFVQKAIEGYEDATSLWGKGYEGSWDRLTGWYHSYLANLGRWPVYQIPVNKLMTPEFKPPNFPDLLEKTIDLKHNYGIHLWCTGSGAKLHSFTPENISSRPCTFSMVADFILNDNS